MDEARNPLRYPSWNPSRLWHQVVGWVIVALFVAGCATTSPLIRDGLRLEEEGRYAEAVTLYKSALATGDARPKDINPRLKEATSALAGDLIRQGRKALAEGQLEEARHLADDARRIAPEHEGLPPFLKQLGEAHVDHAQAAVAEDRMLEAIGILEALIAVDGANRGAAQLRDELKGALTSELEARVRLFEENGRSGNALVASLALLGLYPDQLVRRQDVLGRRSQLLSQLKVPVTFEVISRTRWGRAVQEAMGGLAFQSPLLTIQVGGQTPESLHLLIEQIHADVSTDVEPGTRVKPIPSGSRSLPNPELEAAQKEVIRLEGEALALGERIDAFVLQRNETTAPSERNRLSAEINRLERQHHKISAAYVEASQRAATLPTEVEIPNFRDVRYPVEVHHRVARLKFRLRTVTESTALPLKVGLNLTAEAQESAEAHLAFVQYGIEEKRAVLLTTDEALLQQAVLELVRVVGHTTDLLVNDYWVLQRRMAIELANEGKEEEAIERAVRVLLATSLEPKPVLTALFFNRGISDLAQLRDGPTAGGVDQDP